MLVPLHSTGSLGRRTADGMDSQIRLGKLDAESFVVLLASEISLAMTTALHYALRILHEL